MTLPIAGFLGLGTQELIIIAIVALLIFGGTKLPELGRAVGKTVVEFKKGMKDVQEEVTKPEAPKQVQSQTVTGQLNEPTKA